MFWVVIGAQTSDSSLEKFNSDQYKDDSDSYLVDGSGRFSQLDSPSKHKSTRMLRREDVRKFVQVLLDDDNNDFALERKNRKSKSVRHKQARQDK